MARTGKVKWLGIPNLFRSLCSGKLPEAEPSHHPYGGNVVVTFHAVTCFGQTVTSNQEARKLLTYLKDLAAKNDINVVAIDEFREDQREFWLFHNPWVKHDPSSDKKFIFIVDIWA